MPFPSCITRQKKILEAEHGKLCRQPAQSPPVLETVWSGFAHTLFLEQSPYHFDICLARGTRIGTAVRVLTKQGSNAAFLSEATKRVPKARSYVLHLTVVL